MNFKDKKRIIQRYEERYKKYGVSPESLGWFKGRQSIRFHILTQIGDLHNKSILDVGCGFADFYKFLKQKGWHGKYTGFDIVPLFVRIAKEKYPEVDVRVVDILEDEIEEKFDYVVASGIFNLKLKYEDTWSYVKSMLKKMFELANIGVAVDFTSCYVDFKSEETFYAEPEEIFKFCKKLTRRVVLRHDYMPYEFAIYMYKNDAVIEGKNVFEDYVRFIENEK